MDPVKHATEVFGMVTAEVTSLKAQPDLDPLQKARVVAQLCAVAMQALALCHADYKHANDWHMRRSEEHTSELQSRLHLVCRLLLEKKKKIRGDARAPPARRPPQQR